MFVCLTPVVGSLVIVVQPKAKGNFLSDAMLLFYILPENYLLKRSVTICVRVGFFGVAKMTVLLLWIVTSFGFVDR